MTLMLHAGAEHVDYDVLRLVETPDATKTHVPLPHHHLVDMVRYALGYHGHDIVEEHHAVMPDGQRYFGLMTLKSPYGDYSDTIGLRNAHDKSWPIGIAFGSRVFVCDNTAFLADTVIKRRHTANAKRDLPAIVAGVIEPLRQKREEQHESFERFQAAPLTDELADQVIMRLYRDQVINVTRIADVLDAYENPPHEWGDRTAWRLFNATTYALKGRVSENPQATEKLHTIIEGICEPA